MLLRVLTCVLSFFASVQAMASEHLIPSPIETLFVPLGFDDNDNIEVVVHGHFRNSCYKTGPVDVKVDHENKVVNVYPQAYEYRDVVCALMMVPFIQTVKIGMLPAGKYKVVVANSAESVSQELVVKTKLTDSPDDFLYAPVDKSYVEFGAAGNNNVVISGRYPLTLIGCAIVTDIRVSLTPGNVILVLPIMELLSSDAECRARNWAPRFELKKAISAPLTMGDYLLHVRVLNGNSFNKLERSID